MIKPITHQCAFCGSNPAELFEQEKKSAALVAWEIQPTIDKKTFAHRWHRQQVAICKSCLQRRPRSRIIKSLIALLVVAGGFIAIWFWNLLEQADWWLIVIIALCFAGLGGFFNLVMGLDALSSKSQNVEHACFDVSLERNLKCRCEVCGNATVTIEIHAHTAGDLKSTASGYRCAEHARELTLAEPFFAQEFRPSK